MHINYNYTIFGVAYLPFNTWVMKIKINKEAIEIVEKLVRDNTISFEQALKLLEVEDGSFVFPNYDTTPNFINFTPIEFLKVTDPIIPLFPTTC